MLEIQAIQKSASTTNGHVVSDPVFCMIPASKDLDTLTGLYKKELETAAFKGAETIYFPSLSCSSQPLLFRAISQIYRTILDFGDAGDTSVKKVCIVCEDDDIRNTYMVVWNLCRNKKRSHERWPLGLIRPSGAVYETIFK